MIPKYENAMEWARKTVNLRRNPKNPNPLMNQMVLNDVIEALEDNSESHRQRVEQMPRLGYKTHEIMHLLF